VEIAYAGRGMKLGTKPTFGGRSGWGKYKSRLEDRIIRMGQHVE